MNRSYLRAWPRFWSAEVSRLFFGETKHQIGTYLQWFRSFLMRYEPILLWTLKIGFPQAVKFWKKILKIKYLAIEGSYTTILLSVSSTYEYYKLVESQSRSCPVYQDRFFQSWNFDVVKKCKFGVFWPKMAKFHVLTLSLMSKSARNGFYARKNAYKKDLSP